jgi:hypothetical protein
VPLYGLHVQRLTGLPPLLLLLLVSLLLLLVL